VDVEAGNLEPGERNRDCKMERVVQSRERESFVNVNSRSAFRVTRRDHGETRVSPNLASDDRGFLDTDEGYSPSSCQLEEAVCVGDGFLRVCR